MGMLIQDKNILSVYKETDSLTIDKLLIILEDIKKKLGGDTIVVCEGANDIYIHNLPREPIIPIIKVVEQGYENMDVDNTIVRICYS